MTGEEAWHPYWAIDMAAKRFGRGLTIGEWDTCHAGVERPVRVGES